jgi:hypothetical protein
MQDKFKKAYLKAKNDVDAKKHGEKNRIVALSARQSRAQSPRNQHSWNQGASQQVASSCSFSTQKMNGGNATSQQMSQSTTVQNPQSRFPNKDNTAGVGSKRGGGGNFTGLIHGNNA